MATNSLQAQRFIPKTQQQQQQQQQASVRNQNQTSDKQQSSVRNPTQTSNNFQQTPDRNKVRIKKIFFWIRDNFFPIISEYDSDPEDEEERQALKEERRLIKNPPIIKPELRLSNLKQNLPGLVGIYNHGNTCFISTVMQCLSNTEELARYLVTDQYTVDLRECQKSKKKNRFGTRGELTQQVANLLKSMWLGQYDSRVSWFFIHTVMKHGEQYRGYMQHDAQEFLLWMLDNMHEDLRIQQKSKKGLFSKSKAAVPPSGLLGGQSQLINSPNTIITQLFHGLFFSSISCKSCSKTSISLEPFLCLSLPIPQRQMRPLYITVVKQTAPAVQNTRIGLTVPLICTALDIKREVANREDVPVEYILIFEVYSDSYGRIVSDSDTVSEVQNRGDFFYAFILPKPEQVEGEFENISLICMNVYMYGNHPRRFTFPFIIQVPRDIEVGEIENLVMQRLLAKTKPLDLELLNVIHRMFKIKMVDGMPGKTILSPYDSRPLLHAQTIKPLERSITDARQQYLRVLLEWENDIKSRVFGRYQEFSCDECVSVKNTQIFFRKAHKAGLLDCFELLTQREELCEGEEWFCSVCKGKKPGIKKLDFLDTPDVLIVHLKRFRQVGYLRQKLDTMIDFPLYNLDLSSYMINKASVDPYLISGSSQNGQTQVSDSDTVVSKKKTTKKQKKTKTQEPSIPDSISVPCSTPDFPDKPIEASSSSNISVCSHGSQANVCSHLYDLFGVGNHHGGMTGGHYTAFCKNAINNKWYLLDDDMVQEVNEKKVQTSHAYLLFYKRREVQQAPLPTDQSGGEISPHVPTRDPHMGPEHWINQFSVKIAPPVEPQIITPKATPPTPSHQVMGPVIRRSNTAPNGSPHRRKGEEKHPNSFSRKKIEEAQISSTVVSVPTYNITHQNTKLTYALAQTPSVPNFTGMDHSVPVTYTPPIVRYQIPIKKTTSQPNILQGYGTHSPAAVRARTSNETSV